MSENNFICQYCNKECKNLNSLKQHECRCSENPNRIINIEYKNKLSKTKKIISAIKKQNGYKYPNQIEKEKKIEEYNKNPKLCLECGKPLTYQQFKHKQNFCCHKCSNQNKETRPPRTDESKIKSSNSLKNSNYVLTLLKNNREKYYNNPNKCFICENILSYKNRNHKTCSNECKNILLKMTSTENKNCGGYYKGSGRSKQGWYKGFHCDSSYELVYLIYCLDHNIDIRKCDKIYEYFYEGKFHKYHPDFIVDNVIIEIKGYYNKLVDIKLNSVKDMKYKILYRKDLQKEFDYVYKTYNVNDKTIQNLYTNKI